MINLDEKKKILFIRSAYLGDFIVIIPFIDYCIDRFNLQRSNISFLIFNSTSFNPIQSIYGNDEDFDDVQVVDPKIRKGAFFNDLLKYCFNRTFDHIVYIPFSKENLLKRVVKFIIFKTFFPFTPISGFFGVAKKSMSQYDVPFYTLGLSLSDSVYKSKINNTAIPNKAKQIGLYITSKLDMKIWEFEKYRMLVTMLHQTFNCKFYLLGGKEDCVYNQKFICSFEGIDIVDMAGKLSVKETIEFIKNFDCLIANDGSPIHMASLAGTKVISIFTYKEPVGVWEPISPGSISIRMDVQCRECYKVSCEDVICLLGISVEEVYEAVKYSLINTSDQTKYIVLRGES